MSLADRIKKEQEKKPSLADRIKQIQPKEPSLAERIAASKPEKPTLVERVKEASEPILAERVKEAPEPTREEHAEQIAQGAAIEAAEDKVWKLGSMGFEIPPDVLQTGFKRFKAKMAVTDWVKILMSPIADYYMKLAEHVPLSADVLKALGMPSTVEEIEIAGKRMKVKPEYKYGPLLGSTLTALEKKFKLPFTQLPDRFILGAFIDTLLLKGGTKVLGRMSAQAALKTAKPEQLAQQVADWQKASPELVQFMEREIAKQELAAKKALGLRKATPDEVTKVKKVISEQLYSDSAMAPDEVVLGKTKFKFVDNEWQAVKVSNELEQLQSAKQVIDDTKKMVRATDEATKTAIEANVKLPKPGNADLNPFEKGGVAWYHTWSSPRYVVPELYELHSQKVRLISKMKDKYLKPLKEFADIQETPERAELLAKILDGTHKYPDIRKTWTNLSVKEAQALKQFTESWGELADRLYDVTKDVALKPGNRMLTYLTHIVKNYMEPQKVAVPERLRKMVDLGKRYLKQRRGVKEYSLNPFEAFDEYLNWASEKLADTIIKPQWEEVIAHYGANQASYGKWFWNNLHRVEHTPKAIKDAVMAVRNGMYRATLGWNIAASLVNRTQFFVFGSARIGWGATQRGLRLRNLKHVDSAEGQRIRDILDTSGIYDDMSEFIKKEKFGEVIGPLRKGVRKVVPKWARDPLHIFSESEKFNKETIYLGAYEDILNGIKKLRQLGPHNLPRLAKKFERLGIDATKDAIEEAHKYAYKAMVDTQLDLSKAGQMAMSSNPIMGTLMMYSSFPIKAGEYALHTFTKAAKAIGKEGIRAYNHPEVVEALRFGANLGIMGGILAGLGVSIDDIVGPTNFIAKMSPALKTVLRVWSTSLSIAENIPAAIAGERSLLSPGFRRDTYLDARGRRHFMRDMSIAFGLPGATQMWKIQRFLKTVSDNWDNLTADQWNIYDPISGALKYRTHPISVVKALFFPSKDENEYFEQIKADSDDIRKQREAGRTIQKLLLEGKVEQARELGRKTGIRPRLSRQTRQRRRLTAEERRRRRERGKRRLK